MKIVTIQRLFLPVLSIFLLLSCGRNSEQGNGEIITVNSGAEEFVELKVDGDFDILLIKTDTPAISITTDENLHEFITINQRGNTLLLEAEKELQSTHGVDVTIGYQKLAKLELGGASTLRNEGVLTGQELNLDMAGAGAVKIKVDLKQVKMNIAGVGSVEITGKAQQQAVNMSGAGGLDAKNLATEYTKISISGVGGASVNVSNKLDASVSGVGGITYTGNPKEIKRDVSGLGSIKEIRTNEE